MHPILLAVAIVLAPPLDATDRHLVDSLIFQTDVNTFARQRFIFKRTHPHLDWTSDGCSAPVIGNKGRSFNFRRACIRHDFAYRNYKRFGLLNEYSRLHIDERFHADMVESCAPKRRTFKLRCLAWAEVFYASVRAAGALVLPRNGN